MEDFDSMDDFVEVNEVPEQMFTKSGRPLRQATLKKAPSSLYYELLESPKKRKKTNKKLGRPKKVEKKEVAKKPSKKEKKITDPIFKFEVKAPKKAKKAPLFDSRSVYQLAVNYPDQFGTEPHQSSNTNWIQNGCPMNLSFQTPPQQGFLLGMKLSPDGQVLCSFSQLGYIYIYDSNTMELLCKLRDTEEPNIDEFYIGEFSPNQTHLLVGGKLKDRHRWSEADEDNHILPCPIKIFDLSSGKVVTKLEGHAEEVLSIKHVYFKGESYYLTCSQDGTIIKWKLNPLTMEVESKSTIQDGVTCMAFNTSFVPNCGNKYFLAACDNQVKLFDFELEKVLQAFDSQFSSYCDCLKFIKLSMDTLQFFESELSAVNNLFNTGTEDDEDDDDFDDDIDRSIKFPDAYFVARGVELLDMEENTVASRPNSVCLYRFVFPKNDNDKFDIQLVKKYGNERYYSNSWLIKITSDGSNLLAPTLNGQVFVFDLKTGQVKDILKGVSELEVRDVIIHHTLEKVFICADDGVIYTYLPSSQPIEID